MLDVDDQDFEDFFGDIVIGEGVGLDGFKGIVDLGDVGVNDGQVYDDVEDVYEWYNFGGCGVNFGGIFDDDNFDEYCEDYVDDLYVGVDLGVLIVGEYCELIGSLIGLEYIVGVNDIEGSVDGEERSKDVV